MVKEDRSVGLQKEQPDKVILEKEFSMAPRCFVQNHEYRRLIS
jgi:hypothetical protein